MLNEIAYKKMTEAAIIPDISGFIDDLSKLDKNNGISALAFEIVEYNNINLRLGYEFGSKLLVELVKSVMDLTKEYGNFYRVERTVYAVMFNKDTTEEELKELNLKISNHLNTFSMDGYTFNIEIVSGAIINLKYTDDPFKLLATLTSAVDKSKRTDSFELTIFNEERYNDNMKNMKLLETIKNSIVKDCEGFYLVYQPFISAMNGKVIGAEALIRWKSKEYGVVSPGLFISYIEDHACFYELGLWTLRKALTDFKDILLEKPDFFININLSYSQLEKEEFKYDVLNIAEEVGFPLKNIQLELTERCKNLDISYLNEQINFFRSYGIRMALDDFGTGTSTLRLIGDLAIDCVKIDQSFIINILNNPSNAVIVETVLECAKRLGISVCLEGVENEKVKNYVEKYYANYHQGFYYSKPVELEEFKKKLELKWITQGIKLIKSSNKSTFEVNNIISMMPGGFFVYMNDETERIILANEALLDIFECDNVDEFMELTNQRFSGMVHPDDYPRVDKEIKEQISSSDKKYDRVRYRIKTKKGNIKTVSDYGHLVTKDYNDDVFYVFIVEDI